MLMHCTTTMNIDGDITRFTEEEKERPPIVQGRIYPTLRQRSAPTATTKIDYIIKVLKTHEHLKSVMKNATNISRLN